MKTKRIAVLGGPRCGKTTLIQHLYVEMKIAGLNVGYALEYSTDYLKDKGMIETISEQYGIYLGQKRNSNTKRFILLSDRRYTKLWYDNLHSKRIWIC